MPKQHRKDDCDMKPREGNPHPTEDAASSNIQTLRNVKRINLPAGFNTRPYISPTTRWIDSGKRGIKPYQRESESLTIKTTEAATESHHGKMCLIS
jgi:hypothetical protein